MWRLARETDDKNDWLAGQVPCRCESAPAKGWTTLLCDSQFTPEHPWSPREDVLLRG